MSAASYGGLDDILANFTADRSNAPAPDYYLDACRGADWNGVFIDWRRTMTNDTPIQFRTRGNRRRWQEERIWARKLSLRHRLMLNRDGSKREFLPIRPIWGVNRKVVPVS